MKLAPALTVAAVGLALAACTPAATPTTTATSPTQATSSSTAASASPSTTRPTASTTAARSAGTASASSSGKEGVAAFPPAPAGTPVAADAAWTLPKATEKKFSELTFPPSMGDWKSKMTAPDEQRKFQWTHAPGRELGKNDLRGHVIVEPYDQPLGAGGVTKAREYTDPVPMRCMAVEETGESCFVWIGDTLLRASINDKAIKRDPATLENRIEMDRQVLAALVKAQG